MNRREEGEAAARWWRELADPTNPTKRGAARAALAQLRRAASPIDALMEPSTIDLARRLERTSAVRINRVGMVAAVLSHVRENIPVSVARACGPTSLEDPDSAKLKHGRFRRLLQSSDDDLIDQMRRLVHLLDQKVNVADLAASILRWGDDRERRRWALDYYQAERQPSDISAPNPTQAA